MGAILDYIASAIIFGVLVLSVGRIQTNVNATMYQNTFNVIVQQSAVELARQLEFEFVKVGHHVFGQKVSLADEGHIVFKADLLNNWDTVTVEYEVGGTSDAPFTVNADDFPLLRTQGGSTVTQNFGLTEFYMSYYDSVSTQLTTPITDTDSLNLIRAIYVRFKIEGPEPVIGQYDDTTWSSVTWEKLIFPRNLGKINLVD